jgi:heme exporter protein A
MVTQVRTIGLSRAYDDEYALIGIDANFKSHTVTAILGPNGAGKSTLIQLLTLLVRPTEGEIFFDDHRVDAFKAADRAIIGYVGHRTMLYRMLSGYENLRFFARIYGIENPGERIESLLESVGLSDDAHRPVSEYSRGMAQRLTIARALLPRPHILLLDEPFTGLDQAGIQLAGDLFLQQRDQGSVVLLVSHDLDATNRIADQCLILERGRVQYHGETNNDLSIAYRQVIGQ